MKKLKFFLMSVVAMLAMTTVFTSCTKDIVEDIIGVEEYFIVLDDVSTNLVDANGNNIASTLYNEFTFDNGDKSQSLGKAKDIPYTAFEESMKNFQNELQQGWKGIMPEGGWVELTFSLRAGSAKGEKLTSKTITIQ